MESCSYVSGGKGFVSDESVSLPDAIPRGKNGSMGWALKTPSSFGSNMESSSQEAIENQGFLELVYPEMIQKTLPNGSISDVLGSKVGGERMFHPVTATQNAFSGEEESSSKLSSSVVESNCKDSELIDLKLGGFANQKDAQNFNSSQTTPNLSSVESSMPTKRLRVGAFNSPTPFCQVHGCKKDLSSSKDYHKRHRVCEIHSKTAKVIVSGIEQRFCQQCSRFHLLAEFDDGKRSCRKRLAGHNERRRKPRVGIHSGGMGRLFPSFNGSADCRFQGTMVTASSFTCHDILPSSLPHPQKYEPNNWCSHMKLEDTAFHGSQSVFPITNGQLHPKSLFPSYVFEKRYHHLHDNEVNTATEIKFSGNDYQYPYDMRESKNFSRSLFHNTSIEAEDFTVFDLASTVQGLSGLSDSGRAPSLLSSQSQNSSSHSTGIPITHALIIPDSHAHYGITQVFEKLSGVSPQASASGVPNRFHSSGINSVDETHLDPLLISDGSDAVNFGINGIFQEPEYMSSKDHLSCEDGPTIDLLQLSSQLQRVEHKRQSLPVKQEDNAFFSLRIT